MNRSDQGRQIAKSWHIVGPTHHSSTSCGLQPAPSFVVEHAKCAAKMGEANVDAESKSGTVFKVIPRMGLDAFEKPLPYFAQAGCYKFKAIKQGAGWSKKGKRINDDVFYASTTCRQSSRDVQRGHISSLQHPPVV